MLTEQLARQLGENHHVNKNNCLVTDFAKITGLRILSATTNGTSGLCRYYGNKFYFHQQEGKFVVETV